MNNTFLNSRIALVAFAAVAATVLSSCKDDDDHNHPGHENELITTLRLTLQNVADTTDVREIEFFDPDGEGGLNGTINPDTLRLQIDAVYRGSITLLDESIIDAPRDRTIEVQQEADEHQFFYTVSQGLNLNVTDLDRDQNNLPLGLKASFSTGQPSQGTLRIALHHYDAVPKNGTNLSGETDIEVTFPVRVQQ